jgi:hypothetical protein
MDTDSAYSPAHMATLHSVCISPKVWREFPLGSHNDTHAEAGYFDAILYFISKIKRGEPIEKTYNPNRSSSSSSTSTLSDKAERISTASP